jgi:hypothetical protein
VHYRQDLRLTERPAISNRYRGRTRVNQGLHRDHALNSVFGVCQPRTAIITSGLRREDQAD